VKMSKCYPRFDLWNIEHFAKVFWASRDDRAAIAFVVVFVQHLNPKERSSKLPDPTLPLPLLPLHNPIRPQTPLHPPHNNHHQKLSRKCRRSAFQRIRIQPRNTLRAIDLPHLVKFDF